MDNVFTDAEQVFINAVKAHLQNNISTKKIFWNGVENDCVIAGGFFASVFNNESIKDIDVFILNKNVSVYTHLTDNSPIHENWKIRDTDAGHYLDNPHIHGTATNLDTKVQYILTDHKSRGELLADFDYRHCTVSYVPMDNKLYITRSAFDAIRNKELIENGDNKPKYWREKKFKNRGWRTSAIDHHKGLDDGFDKIVKDALGDMMSRINPVPATMTIKDDPNGIVAQAVDDILYGSK